MFGAMQGTFPIQFGIRLGTLLNLCGVMFGIRFRDYVWDYVWDYIWDSACHFAWDGDCDYVWAYVLGGNCRDGRPSPQMLLNAEKTLSADVGVQRKHL